MGNPVWFLGAFVLACLGAAELGAQVQLLSTSVSPPSTGGGDSRVAANRSALSQDGRYLVFTSSAANLATGQIDANGARDVFLRDLVSATTRLVSHSSLSAAQAGNAESLNPAISADGRFVAFDSKATDLVTGSVDSDSRTDVFLFDRTNGSISLVSHRADSPQQSASGHSHSSSVSADGRFVAYVSSAPDLVAGQVDEADDNDVYLFDRLTGVNRLVSHVVGLPATAANGSITSSGCLISEDGSAVAFASGAVDLVAGQTGSRGIFLYDRLTGQNALVSHTPGNATAVAPGGSGFVKAISADGRHVLFVSDSDNLSGTEQDLDGVWPDLYRFNRATGANTLISAAGPDLSVPFDGDASVSRDGQWLAYDFFGIFLLNTLSGDRRRVDHMPGSNLPSLDSYSFSARISGDGRFVAYRSTAPDLVVGQVDLGEPDWTVDVFVYDRDADRNALASHQPSSPLVAVGLGADDSQGNTTTISGDGSVVAFDTVSSGFLSTDTNNHQDVFTYSRATTQVSVASLRALDRPSSSANNRSDPWWLTAAGHSQMSADGRFVLFTSRSTDLVPGQLSASAPTPRRDAEIYLKDRSTGATLLVSHAAGSTVQPANEPPLWSLGISADGRFVVHQSAASDLVAGFVGGFDPNTYLFDRDTGSNTLVSHTAGNALAAAGSLGAAAINTDGRYVVFTSTGSSLVPGQVDANGESDVFLYDRIAGTMTLVSHRAGEAARAVGGGSPSISADGQRVAFYSGAADVVPGQTGSAGNIFVYDRLSGDTRLASHAAAEALVGACCSFSPVISADGTSVVYISGATNIETPGPPGQGAERVFLYDMASGGNVRVGTGAGTAFGWPSADGRFVAWDSSAFQVCGETPHVWRKVCLFDQLTGARTLVSHGDGTALEPLSGDSVLRGFSADGRFVLFSNDGNPDTYLYDRLTGDATPLSRRAGLSPFPISGAAHMNRDGSQFLFGHELSTLVAGDFNAWPDAFALGIPAVADVAVAKTGPVTAAPGQVVSFTVAVSSVGTVPVENVELLDPTPVGLMPVSVSGACGTFPCALGNLAVGETRQVTATYAIPSDYSTPAPIVNTATVSTTSAEADSANNTASAQVSLPSAYYSLMPCRLADTREGNGPLGGPALSAGSARSFTLTGACGIPDGVKSVVLNATIVAPTRAGFLRLTPGAATAGQTSSVNFAAGQTRANSAVVSLGGGGSLVATLGAVGDGQAHLILDVMGYFK